MSRLQELMNEIRALEARVATEINRDAEALGYTIKRGRAHFEDEVVKQHRALMINISRYLRESSLRIIITAPLIYSLLFPLLLLDIFIEIYHRICFPIYGIPYVKRRDYIIMDRHRLQYLNGIEKIHCIYCSYANGFIAYAQEIAACTEQYWCPIKHAEHPTTSHSRYHEFTPYGDAENYQKRLKELRDAFKEK